jgi:hypothetical protein
MENDLSRRFAEMSDDELQNCFASGQLDRRALSVLIEELHRRGLPLPIPDHAADVSKGIVPSADFLQLVRGLPPLEAQILLGRLHADGVDAHLSGANIAQTNPLWFQALGGVRLFVRREHLAKAIDVMNATGADYDVDDGAEDEGAPRIDRLQRKRLVGWVIVLLVGFVFGGIALAAIWSPSYEYFPYSMTPEPTSHLLGKWLLSALVVAHAAFWIIFVESAVKRQKRP